MSAQLRLYGLPAGSQPDHPASRSAAGRLAALAVLIVLAGCGKGGKQIVPVSGTVTRAGAPVENLFLTFKPTEGRPSWGVTDQQGHYQLKYSKATDGAEVGTHRVWVTFRPRDPSEEAALVSGQKVPPAEWTDITSKYGAEDTSPLNIEVSASNPVIDIALD